MSSGNDSLWGWVAFFLKGQEAHLMWGGPLVGPGDLASYKEKPQVKNSRRLSQVEPQGRSVTYPLLLVCTGCWYRFLWSLSNSKQFSWTEFVFPGTGNYSRPCPNSQMESRTFGKPEENYPRSQPRPQLGRSQKSLSRREATVLCGWRQEFCSCHS